LKNDGYPVLEVRDGKLVEKEVPMLNALNEVLRDDYIRDTVSGVKRWNRIIKKAGMDYELTVPHKGFNRKIGALGGTRISPDGEVLTEAQWQQHESAWLPSESDREYVASLMGRVVEVGKFANWIAPPPIGINRQAVNFEYIRFN